MQVTIVSKDNRISTLDMPVMSITDIRRIYGPRLGILDKTVAVLNNRNIRSGMEAQTAVGNYDRLAFVTQQSFLRY